LSTLASLLSATCCTLSLNKTGYTPFPYDLNIWVENIIGYSYLIWHPFTCTCKPYTTTQQTSVVRGRPLFSTEIENNWSQEQYALMPIQRLSLYGTPIAIVAKIIP
jgi:hypothetical protein